MKENNNGNDTNVSSIENSIEETIKQLKLILKVRKEQKEIIECAGGSCMNCDPDIKALNESIEILSDYKRALKENRELREYIAIAPNLDEMTATKYRNIQQDAYIQGRTEEQQKAEQIIYENYILKQKIKDKIEELKEQYKIALEENSTKAFILKCQITILQELIESEE